VALRVGTGIALLFHYSGTRRGVSSQQHAPAALYPRERPGTNLQEAGWAPGLVWKGRNISSLSGFDPEPSSP